MQQPQGGVVILQTAQHKKYTLNCRVEGDPRPRVTWWKNDERVTRHSRLRLGRKGLVIEQLLLKDSGVYWCAAKNKDGSVESERVTLDVQGKVIISLIAFFNLFFILSNFLSCMSLFI